MVGLPILHSFDVWNYGLYPGADSDNPGLHVRFKPGLTLVLGANGLGKSTLAEMIYRMLTGPTDISALLRRTTLGTGRLEATTLSSNRRRTFARRVADSAAQARARLVFHVNGKKVSVLRSLRDLTLRSCTVDESPPILGEHCYQTEMASLANISTFADWILLLRYIVFYFEDRRSLVWDHTAQRQVLRVLFLDPDIASQWTVREREILQADTRVRNLQAVMYQEEIELSKQEHLTDKSENTKEELDKLGDLQRAENTRAERIEADLGELESSLENARLRFLRLEQDRESRYRKFEMAKLLAVSARLPQFSDSARYILTHLLTDSECLVCGSHTPSVANELKLRIDKNDCVICGTRIVAGDSPLPIEIAEARVDSEMQSFHALESELGQAGNNLAEARQELQDSVNEVRELRAAISDRSVRINALLLRLPPDEADLLEQQQELATLRGRLRILREDLDQKRDEFREFITIATHTVGEAALLVKQSFEDYARDFLFEECNLSWSPRRDQLGQTGRSFDFPSFELDLGGSDFSGVIRRRGPGDVSESQREFIDLAFRMALARVAERRSTASLVIDAPESSLDAVFVDRAAHVLGKFGHRESGNRLVVMSNLSEGELVASLLNETLVKDDHEERIVDLFQVAEPTEAIRTNGEAYDTAKQQLFDKVGIDE